MPDADPPADAGADPAAFLPLAPRDLLILLALADEDRHGYGIVKRVEEESDGSVLLDPANLYRALKRLLRDGLVSEREADPEGGRDDRRRVYAVTALGRQVVAREAERLDRVTEAARRLGFLPRREATP